jgi:hypothetical protein
MDELIQQFLALPVLDSKSEPWRIITGIYSALKVKSLDAFNEAVKPYLNEIKPTDWAIVSQFMPLFFEISDTILTINLKIVNIWEKLTTTKITNDDLLPVTIELLPNNADILKKLLVKIDYVSHIAGTDATAFALTNLYTAAMVKIQQLEKSTTVEQANESTIIAIKQTAKEVSRRCIIHQLKKAGTDFKNVLADSIENYLKENDATTHQAFYQQRSDRTKELITYDIISSQQYSTPMLADKPMIKSLIAKYLVVGDLLITLSRNKYDREYKLIEFAEKFDFHKHVLSAPQSHYSYLYAFSPSSLFGLEKPARQTPEEKFLHVGAHYSALIKNEISAREVIAPGLVT